MSVLGIDFGASYCTASYINPLNGKPDAVRFTSSGDGSVKVPSLIYVTQDGFHFGFQAYNQLEEVSRMPIPKRLEYMPNFIPSIKRVLKPGASEWFFNESFSHLKILSLFLDYIIKQSKADCGNQYHIDKIVISHPVDFPAGKVDLLKEALAHIGYNDVETIMEPIAAVKGFSINHKINENEGILVFDFGGSTIDVAYVQNVMGDFRVATEPKGNSKCGGQDIDYLLYNHLRAKVLNEMGIDISAQGIVDQALLSSCRILKEKFSGPNNAYETMVMLSVNNSQKSYPYRLSRDAFNAIIYPKVNEAIDVANLVVQDVKKQGLPLDKVLLIGGSSQLTLIRELLLGILDSHTSIETCGEKDIVVALGNIVSNPSECRFPPDEAIDEARWIHCKRCQSERCYHYVKKKGYHCVDCGWEGVNVVVVYN